MNDDNVINLHDEVDGFNQGATDPDSETNAMQKYFNNHGESGKAATKKKIYKDPVILGVMGVATVVASFIIYSKFSGQRNEPVPLASMQTAPFALPGASQASRQPLQPADHLQVQAGGASVDVSQSEQGNVSGVSVAVNDAQEIIPGVSVVGGGTSVSVQNSANSAPSVSVTQQPQPETSQVTTAAPKPSATVPAAPVTTSVGSTNEKTGQPLANKPSQEPARVTAATNPENTMQTKTASNTVRPSEKTDKNSQTNNKTVVVTEHKKVPTKQANTDLLVGNFTVVSYGAQKTAGIAVQSNPSPGESFTVYAVRDDKVWLRNKQSGEVIIAGKGDTLPVIGKILSIDQEKGVVKTTNATIQ